MAISNLVSVDGADEFVRSYFRRDYELRSFWDVLEEDEKQVYLNKSVDEINTAFPFLQICRCSDFSGIEKAIFYNALGILNAEFLNVAEKQVQTLKSLGAVKNLRLDQTSMRAVASAETAEIKEEKIPLSSKKAYLLLKPYGFGSFKGVII